MNSARLDFLAHRHAPRVAIIAVEFKNDKTHIHLECGHCLEWAPHFDAYKATETTCDMCGRGIVRLHPAYRAEFEVTP